MIFIFPNRGVVYGENSFLKLWNVFEIVVMFATVWSISTSFSQKSKTSRFWIWLKVEMIGDVMVEVCYIVSYFSLKSVILIITFSIKLIIHSVALTL